MKLANVFKRVKLWDLYLAVVIWAKREKGWEVCFKKEWSFVERLKAMKASDLVQVMVNSLKAPAVRVNMHTFGDIIVEDGQIVCIGCAATNSICRIGEVKFDYKTIYNRAAVVKVNKDLLVEFEEAIDNLRKGELRQYNNLISRNKETHHLAIPEYPKTLP